VFGQPSRASVSISVVRLTPKLRHTAAFDMPASSAAMTASSFSPAMAGGRPPTRPRRLAAARPCDDTLAGQGPLILRKRAEHMEQQCDSERAEPIQLPDDPARRLGAQTPARRSGRGDPILSARGAVLEQVALVGAGDQQRVAL
jgi:hypothetical protein